MGFSRQENWSGLPFPSGDLLDPGIKPGSPALQADDLPPAPEESPSVFRCYIPRDYTLFMSGGPSTAVCQIVCEYMRACPRKTMHHIPKFISSWPEPLGSSRSFRSLALEPRIRHKTRRRPDRGLLSSDGRWSRWLRRGQRVAGRPLSRTASQDVSLFSAEGRCLWLLVNALSNKGQNRRNVHKNR